jgi:hypothetical protein
LQINAAIMLQLLQSAVFSGAFLYELSTVAVLLIEIADIEAYWSIAALPRGSRPVVDV